MKKIRKYQRLISVLFIFVFANTMLSSLSLAITGHSSMPEYRTFEPVSSANMVNLMDGSFSYNIPLLDVPNGYPINISYNTNNVNNESQASWVGLGWTLNPGSINRLKRGVPDEFDGQTVTYHNRMEKNWTLGVSPTTGLELFSQNLGLSLGSTLRYNNFKGTSRSVNLGFNFIEGLVSLNLSYSGRRFGFSPEINPGALFTRAQRKKVKTTVKEDKPVKLSEEEAANTHYCSKTNRTYTTGSYKGATAGYSPVQQLGLSLPSMALKGGGFTFEFTLGWDIIPANFDFEVGMAGTYSHQKPKNPVLSLPAYGYFNSEKAYRVAESMMDYHTERENVFEKRDKILGYPIATSDLFSVSGEGVGGSFRGFRSEFGYYKKNQIKSNIDTYNAGVDINPPPAVWVLGANVVGSVGGSASGGNQKTTIGNWNKNLRSDYDSKHQFTNRNGDKGRNEKIIFRYSNDLVGSIDNTKDESPIIAGGDAGGLTGINVKLTINEDGFASGGDLTGRIERSSYIQLSPNRDFSKKSKVSGQDDYDMQYLVHTQDLHIINEEGIIEAYDNQGLNRKNRYGESGIGEVVTYNNDGVKYVYGLPLHTRKEKQLSYSTILKGGELVSGLEIESSNNLLARINRGNANDLDSKALRKRGYEQDAAYATQHLLTEIVSPDYIDRTMNGPSPDDFGSYTKFNYKRIAGGDDNWYPYRSPYEGLTYDYGSLSEKKDNTLSVSWGEKEIYFVHSITSKTHVAIFTLADRNDGVSGMMSNDIADIISPNYTINNNRKQLQKLKRVDLYSIKECNHQGGGIYEPKKGATPIKTVHFDYDYSLCKRLPNNINTSSLAENDYASDAYKQSGKLTLKKIWFEYGGKLTSKVSPYEFKYNYPSSNIYDESKYQNLANNYDLSLSAQNPDYKALNTDRWGEYRNFEKLKEKIGDLSTFFPYNYQGDLSGEHDPAAYKLKQIKLPSGGELHVQYEENDYQYVQDKRAMVMVPLSSDTGTDETDKDGKKYYLDLEKIGIKSEDITQELVEDLFEPMREKENPMFFSFLYRLVRGGKPDFQTINSEFIEGYVKIKGYGIENGKAYFYFDNYDGTPAGGTNINYPSKKDLNQQPNKFNIPRRVCQDFYLHNRSGRINNGGNGVVLPEEDASSKIALLNQVKGAAQQLIKNASPTKMIRHSRQCMDMDPEMSIVRLQLPVYAKPNHNYLNAPFSYGKKGSGVRVRHLVMYDKAAALAKSSNSLEPFIYGNEYNYKTTLNNESGVISSGVATSEPVQGRRESPLVLPLNKDKQTKASKLLYGRDMYDMEEPLGESLYPSPMVGYSKITINSIHSGKTNTGYEEHEFYTCKDQPFRAKRSHVRIKREFPIKVGTAFTTKGTKTTETVGEGEGADDGVNEETTSKSGKKSFGFSYERKAPYLFQGYTFIMNDYHGKIKSIRKYSGAKAGEKPAVISEQKYIYSLPGEAVAVMDENQKITTSELGKEGEVYAELNQVTDFGIHGSVSGEFSAGVWTAGAFPGVTALPTLKKLSMRITDYAVRTHVTTKIIRYATVLKEVHSKVDGVKNITYNDVFDQNTGTPIVTRTIDDFDNMYQNLGIKAAWKYPNMRSTYLNTNVTVEGATVEEQNNVTYLAFGTDNCGALDNFAKGDLLELKTASATNEIYLYHTDNPDFDNNRIEILRSGYSKSQLVSGQEVVAKVIRSGYTNELNATVGSVTRHLLDYEDPSASYSKMQTDLYGSDLAFVEDLNTALDQAISNYDGSGNEIILTLTDTYDHLSVEVDNCSLSDICTSGNKVGNIKLAYMPQGNSFTLKVKSLNIYNSSGTFIKAINCEEDTDLPRPEPPVLARGEEKRGFDIRYDSESLIDFVNSKDYDRSILSYTAGSCSLVAGYNSWRGGKAHTGASTDYALEIQISPGNYTSWDREYQSRERAYRYRNVRIHGGKKVCKNYGSVKHSDGTSSPFSIQNFDGWGKPGYHQIDYSVKVGNGKRCQRRTNNGKTSARYCVPFFPDHRFVLFQLDPCDPASVGMDFSFGQTADDEWIKWHEEGLINLSITWTFTDVISGSIITSNEFEPIWPFTTGGTYKIKCEVSESIYGGETYSETREFTVTDCFPCSKLISASNLFPCWEGSPVPVSFTAVDAIGNNDCGNGQTSYDWAVWLPNGGRTAISHRSSLDYSFDSPGDYTVVLETRKELGSGGFYEKRELIVKVLDCRPATASIEITNPTQCPSKEVTFTAVPPIPPAGREVIAITKYRWDFGDGTVIENGSPIEKHVYQDCGSHEVSVQVSNSFNEDNPHEATASYTGNAQLECHGICDCMGEFPLVDASGTETKPFTEAVGKFLYNTNSGTIVFKQTTCPTVYPFTCFSICGDIEQIVAKKRLDRVIAASASTFSQDWDYSDDFYPTITIANTFLNDYETGRKGNWRPDAQYVFRKSIDHATKNYAAGTFTLTMFDWDNIDNNNETQWVNTSNTLLYTPNGEPTEDVNILGVFSTSKYGYNGTLPVLVAQNAEDHTVAYTSFERTYKASGKTYFEDGLAYKSGLGTLISSDAHTGKYAILAKNGSQFPVAQLVISEQMSSEGVMARIWVKNTGNPDALKEFLTTHIGDVSVVMQRVSSGGEWQLYEALFSPSMIAGLEGVQEVSLLVSPEYNEKVVFDDFRIQPMESEMVCYVYDKAQRLIAVLDDQHYAMIYQYNSEGLLVRKLKETVNGVKTISETQYNTQGVQRVDLQLK